MSSEHVDVVVIGGGPAGSTVATLLKRYDPARRITLLEQARFPRHHVGESTLPEMNRILHKMGVLGKVEAAGFVRKRGVTFKWGDGHPLFTDIFSEGVLDGLAGTAGHIPDYSWQVDRSRYDALLLDHARETGVDVHEDTRVDGVLRDGDRITGVVTAAGDTWSSQFVVDASGQARALGRWLGLTPVGHVLGDVAVYRYYRGFQWNPAIVGSLAASKIFVAATRSGWMWFIPLSETDVSVGLVTRAEILAGTAPATLFDTDLAGTAEITSMLSGAIQVAGPGDTTGAVRTHTVADWSYNHEVTAGPGYYLAGDAAAFVDPILSSGVLLAHQAGLSVANAIYSEWHVPDIRPEELHASYAAFYRDLYGGFLRMAQWWYQRRDVGIDEWLRLARELGREARGAQQLPDDDAQSFMTFAAGFLTDYRFVNIGFGYGDEGVGGALDYLEQRPVFGDRLRRVVQDRSAHLHRRFERVDVEAYLATDIDTNRWWRLPLVRFTTATGEQTYRPPILAARHGDAWVGVALRAIERLLHACDGTMSVEQLVRRTRDSFESGRRADVQQLCNIVLADLTVMGLLSPDTPSGP